MNSILLLTIFVHEYTSAAVNNGSDYFGTSANTPLWNWSTAIVMFLGRYLPLILALAIAGSFTLKDRKEAIKPIKTHGPLFISVLLVMTFLQSLYPVDGVCEGRTGITTGVITSIKGSNILALMGGVTNGISNDLNRRQVCGTISQP